MDKKELKEMFRDFLFNLEKFLEMSALYMAERVGVAVLYLQEPQEMGDSGFQAKGLIQIGRHASPVEIVYAIDLDDIEIRSKFFKYHLTAQQMKEFLDELRR